MNVLSGMVDEEEKERKMGSKPAKIVGHIAGDIIGMLVSEQFRKIGTFFGDAVREIVKELLITNLDHVLQSFAGIHMKRKKQK